MGKTTLGCDPEVVAVGWDADDLLFEFPALEDAGLGTERKGGEDLDISGACGGSTADESVDRR